MSGLVQFSGEGIVSGVDDHGRIRGVGVVSWPLDNPPKGPAFTIAIRGVEHFAQAGRVRNRQVIFHRRELTPEPGPLVLALEGHYFPPPWRRFIRTHDDDTKTITVLHPAMVWVTLKVILPPENCDYQGFIGLELYSNSYPNDPTPTPSFMLNGSSGNMRRNKKGEWLGDQICCMYPRMDAEARRSIDYRMRDTPSHGDLLVLK